VFGVVRNHVDQEVEAVRNGERAFVVAVERDELELGRSIIARRNRDLPVVGRE